MISIGFSPDGQTLASPNWNSTIHLQDVATGTIKQVLIGHTDWVSSVVFSPDGNTLVSGSRDNTIRLWDVATGLTKKALSGHTCGVISVAFSPDGRTLASGSWDGTTRLWDIATRTPKWTRKYTDWISSVAFSPDGKMLAEGSYDSTIRLCDVATGTTKHTLKGHTNWVGSVVFGPDGKTLASANYDNTLRLWDVAMRTTRWTLEGHTDCIRSVAFSPDGTTLATGSGDSTVRLWDVVTGITKQTLKAHTCRISSVAFSPDGNTLAERSDDGTLRLWDVATGATKWTEGFKDYFKDYLCIANRIAGEAMNPVVKAHYSLPTLTESDIYLVGMWGLEHTSNLDFRSIIENYATDEDLARLLSARSAEKIATEFYRNYGKKVRDISITQTDETAQSDWKSCDLDVDGRPVDVKNSRESQHSKNRYSEYFIPQFKQDRKNQAVTIAGVFSPSLSGRGMLQPPGCSEDLRVTFLGETNRAQVEKLREEFDSLVEFGTRTPMSGKFLPPWVFEYPDSVYTKRNKALTDFKDFSNIVKSRGLPFWRGLVPVAIASKTEVAGILNHNAMDDWERTFLNQLCNRIEKYGLSLPFVFLTVLNHFLGMAAYFKSVSDFNPDRYRGFLFYENRNQPLGIYDPLKTIDALIHSLGTLWSAKDGLISTFGTFKLMSFNLLWGKSGESDRWTTLIAYCGDCGKTPLVLGESELCVHRRLICPQCDYCCPHCREDNIY